MQLQATLDAIAILDATYTTLVMDGTPQVVRGIIYRALHRLNDDAHTMLTGPKG